MAKLNVPNKLTIARLFFIPLVMACVFLDVISPWNRLLAALLFGIAALTDVADGYVARKYNLITDFGKFLDPLADKFLVFGALVSILVYEALHAEGTEGEIFVIILFISTMIVIFRELMVTSLRLIVVSNPEKIVIPANRLGKTKTGLQDTFIIFALVGAFIPNVLIYHIICYVWMFCMTVMTVWSGINYVYSYRKYINPNK